ncbi:MAG: U32 family peptidase [Pseudomonadota bacterium]
MTTLLELLAPAGNAEIGMAAIDHGADAVYIGGPKFGARFGAGNALTDIERLIQYAHLFYARVYVALNTILTDRELPEALNIIRSLYGIGADGVIIQDVGLLELDLPPISLIASTQMHNATPEKVRFLEALGFRRVILARELSLKEIAAIRRETGVALEVFVHGALCVSYSGQCYMSQAVAKRSANRGVCAQPCRFRYTLTDGEGKTILYQKFPLSLKDMNRIDAIADLVAAGITSFKIEGRYKDIEYVKNITAAYRLAIDRFLGGHPDYSRASSGAAAHLFSPDPERTFNRGYTAYFLFGGEEKIASMDTQKAIGQYVGTISAIEKDFFRLKTGELQNGDGICFLTAEKKLAGCRIERVRGDDIYPGAMKHLTVGTALYRNHDQVLTRLLNKQSARRRIGVDMDFFMDETGLHLVVTDEDGNRTEHRVAARFEPARDPSRMAAQIETQLSSTGNTPFQVRRVRISPGTQGFVPLATLNGVRREALEALAKIRLQAYPRPIFPLVTNTVPYPERILDFHANVLNDHARRFYERHGAAVAEPAFETFSEPAGKTVMTTRYCIRRELDACFKSHQSTRRIKDPLRITDGRHVYRLEFDCRECRMSVILERA